MPRKISSSHILRLSAKTFRSNLRSFLFFGGLFLALLLLLEMIFGVENPFLLRSLLESILYAKLAVLIHRAVLLQERGVENVIKWRWHEFNYMLAIIALMLVIMVMTVAISLLAIFLPLDSIPEYKAKIAMALLFFGVFLVVGYFASRIALVFPGIAVDKTVNIPEIWQKTKPHSWEVFFLVVAFPVLMSLLLFFITYIPVNDILLAALATVLSVFVVMFEVMLLSHCYSEIILNKCNELGADEVVE